MANRKRTKQQAKGARRGGADRSRSSPFRSASGARHKPAARAGLLPPPPPPPGSDVDVAADPLLIADPEPAALPRFPIVGMGASAGGLEACSKLLESIPRDIGAALILVQHLSPKQESILPEILAASAHIPVIQVTDAVQVEPGRMYVIPPNAQMRIDESGRLRLLPRPDDHTQYKPVDFFFRALAAYAQNRAIGVVLSGTDSDGSAGLREIKGVGGITIAQEPRTAKYDGMPRSAIATGMVDLVLSPEELATELVDIARHPFVRHEYAADEEDGSGGAGEGEGEAEAEAEGGRGGGEATTTRGDGDSRGDGRSGGPAGAAATAERGGEAAAPGRAAGEDQLARIFLMLRNATGVDFTHYKLPTIKRRLQRRMVLHKLSSTDQYVRMLQQNPGEVRALYQDILIHVTRFFRDPDTFSALAGRVFPALLEKRSPDQPVRIWVPGCATGEEAYSVAIALLEHLGDNAHGVTVQLFATDVSETAIEHARTGLYPESIAADVSADRLRRFFTKVDGSYKIAKAVRDVCVFARQDLTRDPPFSKLDLIVCRNVLIYLGPILQKKLMNVFHYALKPTGFLMLGNAETIGPHSDLFGVADKRHRLYAKKLAAVRADLDFPPVDYTSERGAAAHKGGADVRSAGNVQNEANRVILQRFSPPGVVIDGELDIVQFRGQTGAFLEPAPGEASLNLLKMAREGLLYGLRTALHEARRGGAAVRKDGLRVKHNGRVRDVGIEVIPLTPTGDGKHYLVLFHENSGGHVTDDEAPILATPAKGRGKGRGKRGGAKGAAADAAAASSRDGRRVARLQEELAASREYLQSIIQDLEAANEELQSANEEILSANEELQSTNEELDTAKEELQSTNEELNTVNEELQARNEELSRVNSDLINLLGSVQIAIVMVASDLRIRRFTPMAEKVLNLIPTDVGRPISDIKPNIDCPDLERLISGAIESVTTEEREVRDRHGNMMLLRIRPYKNVENRIDGAVLALFDIDAARRQDQVQAR